MSKITTKPNNALRRARQKAGITQAQLADRAGIPEATIGRLDSNPSAKISLIQAATIARALNCNIFDLLP